MRAERIFLVGLSGGGKTTVARLAADRLGWEAVDTDDLIEQRAGKRIADIFRDDGEDAFRRLERQAVAEAAGKQRVVVATGGGAILSAEGREAIARGFVVWLSLRPAAAAARVANDGAERPLLAGGPEPRLTALLNARKQYYELADAAIDVESMTAEQVAEEVLALWGEARTRTDAPPDRLEPEARDGKPGPTPVEIAAIVTTPTTSYPVVVEEGAIDSLGRICRDAGLGGRAFVITDDQVGPRFAERVEVALGQGGFESQTLSIAAGEANKTLATVSTIYEWLLDHRAERSDFVVCLGGGVVTDLAGFSAATYLRGMAFVHVPTTLLGMVDAAIGGKTGVDLARGKNLVGAFAQPAAVVSDPAVLESLPERHLRNGWAEVIKHGLILDVALVEELEAASEDSATLRSPRLIAWSTAIKARIVSEDEREAGERTLLNYGHTVGHAIEAVTGYGPVLHGEAVAVGMRAAGIIAVEMGLLTADDLARQQALLRAYGLPESLPGLDPAAVIAATALDKKVKAGSVRWVLLEEIGAATTRDDVPAEVVHHAVSTVLT